MERRPVLLAGVPTATEVKLRSGLVAVDFVLVGASGLTRELLHNPELAAAVVWLDKDVEAQFNAVRDLSHAGVSTVVVGPSKDPDLILRAMREGAREYFVAGDDEAITNAVRAQVRPLRGNSGVVYSVFPAKGGVGATTIACNLAGAMQKHSERTALVDLNLNMGDVLAFLDVAGGYSIANVITNMGRLDSTLLDSALLKHSSGIHVLAQSHDIEHSDRVDASSIPGFLDFLRRHYAAVVLDGIRNFDDLSVAAIDASDHVLLVVSQEVPAVRDAKRCVDLFRRLGAEPKLKLVVNRYQKGVQIDRHVIEETIGIPVAAVVANDYPSVIRSVNQGVLLREVAPRAPVTRDIDSLTGILGRDTGKAGAGGRPGLLRRFFVGKAPNAA